MERILNAIKIAEQRSGQLQSAGFCVISLHNLYDIYICTKLINFSSLNWSTGDIEWNLLMLDKKWCT